jgi:predicted nucleic acid-binding protein
MILRSQAYRKFTSCFQTMKSLQYEASLPVPSQRLTASLLWEAMPWKTLSSCGRSTCVPQIIIDTSMLVPRLDARDSLRQSALPLWSALQQGQWDVLVFDCVVNETISVLCRRFTERQQSAERSEAFARFQEFCRQHPPYWSSRRVEHLFPSILDLLDQHEGRLNFHMFAPPSWPPASARGRCWLAVLAASPAPRGGRPPRPGQAAAEAGGGGLAGVSRCAGLGTAGWGKWGDDFKQDFKAQRGEIPRRWAHVVYEATPRVVDESSAKSAWRQWAGAIGVGGTRA